MNKGIMKSVALLLVMALFISGAVYPLVPEAAANSAEVVQLKKGEPLNAEFSEEDGVHWYQIEPSTEDLQQDTHMKIEIEGTFAGNLAIYPDQQRADQDITFDDYRAEITEGVPAVIHMPHAWKGPFLIKVEYLGTLEETEPDAAVQQAGYSINYEGVQLSPTDMPEAGCPVELSLNKRASGVAILKELRHIRDGVLSKTEKGRQLSALYYKVAPFLVTKMTFDKKVKEQIYRDLVVLQPLTSELSQQGDTSRYRLTAADQAAILDLYNMVSQNVPDWLKAEVEKTAKEINIQHLTGKELSVILQESGLSGSKTDTDRVIVKLKSGQSAAQFGQKAKKVVKSASVKTVKEHTASLSNTLVMEMDADPEKAADRLEDLPEVEYAEPVQTYRKSTELERPFADIQSGWQWSLKNTGQGSGKADADIGFNKLYTTLQKRANKTDEVKIAIIDTGVDHTLADLESSVLKGYDFVNRDDDAYDDEGHGTHVSGIIAAEMDNNHSMTGIHPNVKILPVKVLDAGGEGDTDKIALGIKYAVDNGANVINLSLGGDYSRVIEEMLRYAASKNVTVVAASGNASSNMLEFPAGSKYTIAVGASNKLDIVPDFSSFGKGLDLVAPGADIPSLMPNGNIIYLSGTSMAAPHVSATAGLLISQKKGINREEIRKVLIQTTDDIAVAEPVNPYDEIYVEEIKKELPPGYDEVSGWGRLNVWSAYNTVGLGLTVNPLTDNDSIISGKAAKGTYLELKDGKTLLGKGTAGANGNYSFNIKRQKAQKVLQLKADKDAATVRVTVTESPAPKPPKVNPVSDRDLAVAGKSEKGTTVTVKKGKEVLGKAAADAKGNFKVKLKKKQKAGTKLQLTATSPSGKTSKAAGVKVIDKTPPAQPKVNAVKASHQTVTGKTEAGALVVVKVKGKKIGEKKADSKGGFKVSIKKQKAGTHLYVTAKDAAGNVSGATKVKIGK